MPISGGIQTERIVFISKKIAGEFKTSNSTSKKRTTMLFYEATRTSAVSTRRDFYVPPDTSFSDYYFPSGESITSSRSNGVAFFPRGHVNVKNLSVVLPSFVWLAKGRTRRNNRNCAAVAADDRYCILYCWSCMSTCLYILYYTSVTLDCTAICV